MKTRGLTRHILYLISSASFLVLVAMVTRALSQHDASPCPPLTFGERCRLKCQCEDDAQCDRSTGVCPGNCREGWSGPNCQTQNVVLGMPTEMRTPDWSKGAWAVDGNPRTCVTSSSNRTGWWKVDMLVSRSIFFMDIVFANQTARMGRIRVHVSDYLDTFFGKPCTRIPISHTRTKFSCDVPSKGRYFGIINKFGQITLCEVRVFVCSPFTFGVDCSKECSCGDPSEMCNPVTGACKSGCKIGWRGSSCQKACFRRYGKKCRNYCGHCRDNAPCDHVTGRCANGCQPGWMGNKCLHTCHAGYYGEGCVQKCHHCLDNVTCEPTSGKCPWRCSAGWQGDKCASPCYPGWHGQSCEFHCGNCLEGSYCNLQTGVCPLGCRSGYEGLFCTQGCLAGFWGNNCRWKCSHCVNSSCDRVTGQCDFHGCLPGWKGLKCDTECNHGTYGPMCSYSCGFCKGSCDYVSGLCRSPCRAGWRGPKCLEMCSNHTYGDLCTSKCGQCAEGDNCHHVTGLCPGKCEQNYRQPSCTIRLMTISDQFIRPNLYVFLIVCIAVVICIICVIGTSLIFKWRRARQTPCKYRRAPPKQQTTV